MSSIMLKIRSVDFAPGAIFNQNLTKLSCFVTKLLLLFAYSYNSIKIKSALNKLRENAQLTVDRKNVQFHYKLVCHPVATAELAYQIIDQFFW